MTRRRSVVTRVEHGAGRGVSQALGKPGLRPGTLHFATCATVRRWGFVGFVLQKVQHGKRREAIRSPISAVVTAKRHGTAQLFAAFEHA